MIYTWLHKHLPSWLATLLCGTTYAVLIMALWIRWDAPRAAFRYIGL